MRHWPFSLVLLIVTATGLLAAPGLDRRIWSVAGVSREAFLAVPKAATTSPTPVIFVFHGHGGSMENAARTFYLHTLWPEALVVYPQGLNTVGRLTDPEGRRAGWQARKGDEGNRDLAFVDAILVSLKAEYLVDPKRVFATGHSNGGGFTYLLWAERADVFTAFAPSASVVGRAKGAPTKPRPVLHIAGERDELVKFAWQKLAIEFDVKLNRCAEKAESWAPGGSLAKLYPPQEGGAPVLELVYPGGHGFFDGAPVAIVQFFKIFGERVKTLPVTEVSTQRPQSGK